MSGTKILLELGGYFSDLCFRAQWPQPPQQSINCDIQTLQQFEAALVAKYDPSPLPH